MSSVMRTSWEIVSGEESPLPSDSRPRFLTLTAANRSLGAGLSMSSGNPSERTGGFGVASAHGLQMNRRRFRDAPLRRNWWSVLTDYRTAILGVDSPKRP